MLRAVHDALGHRALEGDPPVTAESGRVAAGGPGSALRREDGSEPRRIRRSERMAHPPGGADDPSEGRVLAACGQAADEEQGLEFTAVCTGRSAVGRGICAGGISVVCSAHPCSDHHSSVGTEYHYGIFSKRKICMEGRSLAYFKVSINRLQIVCP